MSMRTRSRHHPVLWKPALYWGVVGLFITFGIASLPSIGMFVLIAAALLILWAVIRRISPRTLPAALVGGGLTPLYIAAINWRGPGMFCRESTTSQVCTEHLDPVPFVLISAALILIGVGAFWLSHRRMSRG